MSYQVLARKWRPKTFMELVGQEHVVNVLENALAQQRIHHAYLFTGTRGVGKTTIARIFAKSLNCEQGITEKPCGACTTCLDIDNGRFIDLLEIDAASKTKVDDTREILDNVQYAPTKGRYKVYLIDEVHMLSRHSFNALLKTLEEPPAHVKFILATTDPQKLPITVLSRCLQFHLKALTVGQIESKLNDILSSEQVTHQAGTLTMLAKAARGSMRDSLSLTDQAIAQGQGHISLDNIQQMLGGIDQNWVYKILIALLKRESESLISLSQEIASYAPSYSRLFAELIQLLHQVALMQVVNHHFDLPAELVELLKKFSQAMAPEDVQLYYQIAINGRKDLPYASDEQAAFDMTLLRMLAFEPMKAGTLSEKNTKSPMFSHDFSDSETQSSQVIHDKACDEKTNDDNVRLDKVSQSEAAFIERAKPQTQVNQTSSDFTNASPDTLEVKVNLTPQSQVKEARFSEDNVAVDDVDSALIANEQLSEQMRSIEQQAQEIQSSSLHAESNFSEIESSQSQLEPSIEPNAAPTSEHINSPVGAVLATRNMLRSRKKQLEQQVKKSDDAIMRQDSTDTISEIAPESKPVEPKNIIPEPIHPYQADRIDPAIIKKANQVDKWAHMIDAMELTARIRQLAIHATIGENSTPEHLILQLDQATKHLNTQVAQQQLQDYICQFLSKDIQVTVELVEKTIADPYQIQSHINDKRYDYAKNVLKNDAIVLALQEQFQATLDEESIIAH